MTLGVQWLTVAVMMASGLGMGAVFDGYRVVSNELRFPRWLLPVLDIVYWMVSAVAVFRMLYASNNGEVRAYVFLGLALGVILYYWLFSRIVITLVRWLIHAVQACIRFLLRLFNIIVIGPVLLLYKLIRLILAFGTALTVFLLKIVLQLFRPVWLLLSWLVRPLLRPLGRWLAPHWRRLRIVDRCRSIGLAIAGQWNRWFGREEHK